MKKLLAALLLLSVSASAQTGELAKATGSPDRKAILDALRIALKPDLKLAPKLVVESLKARAGFAFFAGSVRNESGGEIDFRKTVYREHVEEGLFDGPGTHALLKKVGGRWKVLAYAIGPTDVPWGCWWKEFKAPKEIFDYTEKCTY